MQTRSRIPEPSRKNLKRDIFDKVQIDVFYSELTLNTLYQDLFQRYKIKNKGFVKYEDQKLHNALVFRKISANINSPLYHVGLAVTGTIYEIDGEPTHKNTFRKQTSVKDFYKNKTYKYCIELELTEDQEKQIKERLNSTKINDIYNLFSNNCEHWCIYMLLGEKISNQVSFEFASSFVISCLNESESGYNQMVNRHKILAQEFMRIKQEVSNFFGIYAMPLTSKEFYDLKIYHYGADINDLISCVLRSFSK